MGASTVPGEPDTPGLVDQGLVAQHALRPGQPEEAQDRGQDGSRSQDQLLVAHDVAAL